jgi:hypothetical protein
MAVALIDYSDLSEPERQTLTIALSSLGTLEKVLAWARQLEPPTGVEEILTQDEYTHDVLIPFKAGRYLNFDTT